VIKIQPFDVRSNPDVKEWEARVKNLSGITAMSIKNTGKKPIHSLLIHVEDGSLVFAKAKNWSSKRMSAKDVLL
jgi:hypothetical protein